MLRGTPCRACTAGLPAANGVRSEMREGVRVRRYCNYYWGKHSLTSLIPPEAWPDIPKPKALKYCRNGSFPRRDISPAHSLIAVSYILLRSSARTKALKSLLLMVVCGAGAGFRDKLKLKLDSVDGGGVGVVGGGGG